MGQNDHRIAASHAAGRPPHPDAARLLQIAVLYQMVHGIALVLAGVLARFGTSRWLGLAGAAFLAGVALFCGSLYWLAFTGVSAGIVAPVGGVSFIAGWVLLAAHALAGDRSEAGWSSSPTRIAPGAIVTAFMPKSAPNSGLIRQADRVASGSGPVTSPVDWSVVVTWQRPQGLAMRSLAEPTANSPQPSSAKGPQSLTTILARKRSMVPSGSVRMNGILREAGRQVPHVHHLDRGRPRPPPRSHTS